MVKTDVKEPHTYRHPRLLSHAVERRRQEPDSETNREPDQSHEHLGGGWLAGV